MIINYEAIFGSKPKEISTPMIKMDHLELDNTELLDQLGVKHYQTLIVVLQLRVSFGNFDIHF